MVLDVLHATTEKTAWGPCAPKRQRLSPSVAGTCLAAAALGSEGQTGAFDSDRHGKELQRYCHKVEIERGSHAGHKSGKFSRTVSMFMRVLVKKMNVQETYKYNSISSYYRYRNHLIIPLEIHLYLLLLAESLQKPNEWWGCYHAESSAFHPEQHCSRGSLCSAAAPVSALLLCTALKAQAAFWQEFGKK